MLLNVAMKSSESPAAADLAASAIVGEAFDSYPDNLQRDMVDDLEFASRLTDHFFHGRFLWGPVTARMVQFTRLSPTFRGLMQDLFAGTQPYLGLRERVFGGLKRSLGEIAVSSLLPGRRGAS